MNGTAELDTVLDVCGHRHRRIILAVLENQNQSISVNDLTNEIIKHNHHTPLAETPSEKVTEIQTRLHHTHLPKLVEAGFIKYDPEGHVVEPTAQLGAEESHLSTTLDMDSELPTI